MSVCLFVCSPTPPRSMGRSSPNLEGRWRAAPNISLRGSFFERSRSSRSKVKFMFFSVCSPTSPRSLGRSSPNLVGRLRAAPDISSRGSFFKGQGHRDQRSRSSRSMVKFMGGSVCPPTSPRSLGRSSPNLVGRLRAVPDISSRGSFLKVIEIKGQGHRGQWSNLLGGGFCLSPYFSQVLGPIFTKLGGKVEGGPGY